MSHWRRRGRVEAGRPRPDLLVWLLLAVATIAFWTLAGSPK